MRRLVSMLIAVALAVGVAAIGIEPASAAPSADAAPASGLAGTTTTITGSGYSPGFDPCLIFIGQNKASAVEVDTCSVNGTGQVSETITIPAGLSPNSYTVFICNFCLNPELSYEFSEIGETGFQVLKPPPPSTTTTTTTTVGNTTTSTSTTTTVANTTTTSTSPGSTTTSTQPPEELEDPTEFTQLLPIDGRGVPNMGPGSPFADAIGAPWEPIRITDHELQLPDYWLRRCGAPPGSHVIDFDDQELGTHAEIEPPDDSDGLTYFLDPEGTPATSASIVAPAAGTWTAPHAARFDMARLPYETPIHDPLTIRNANRMTYFGVHVGLAEDVDSPVVVELAALNRNGLKVDTDRIELGAVVSPVTSCLIITAPVGGAFEFAELSVSSASGRSVPILVDNIYWSDVDQYPITPDPEPVQVEIYWPAPTVRLSTAHNAAVLGRITWASGRAVPQVHIAVPTWDSTGVVIRRAETGRPRTDDGRRTASFWLDAIRIPSGRFDLSATASGPALRGGATITLEGIGPPSPPRSEYLDLVEGQVDIIPWAMEVTQAVRGPLIRQAPGSTINDDFNHVAGKRTVVRGYATHEIPESLGIRTDQLFAGAVLHGMRDGVTLPFSPLQTEASTTRVFGLGIDEAGERATRPFAQNTFNFVLPYTWTAAGDIQLRLEVNPRTSPSHVNEMPGTDGHQNTIGQDSVTFTDVGRVGVSAVNVEVHWTCTEDMVATENTGHPCFGLDEGDEVATARSADEMRTTTRDWWKAFPAPGDYPNYFSYSEISLPHILDNATLDVDRTIVGRATTVNWEDWRNAYWDLYCNDLGIGQNRIRPPSVRDFIWMGQPPSAPLRGGGCAWVNLRSAFRANTFWATTAQEVGHTMGLRHTSNAHGELGGGSAVIRFSGDHGEIGTPGQSTSGFDTSAMQVVSSGGSHVHDFMSYGGGTNWISVDTWDHIFTSLRDNRTLEESRGPVISSGPGGEVERAGAQGNGEALIVSGRIDDDAITVAPVHIGDADAYFFPEGSDITVTIEGRDGPVSRTVPLTGGGTHGGSSKSQFVAAFPPDLEAIGSLTVQAQGIAPLTIEATPGTEKLRITDATADLIAWTPGSTSPPFTVEASDDGGASWWLLGTTSAPSFGIDRAVNPLSGDGWVVRVQGSNGPSVHLDTTSIDFGVPAPIAAIGSPLDGDRIRAGMAHAFASVGAIGDPESEYQWFVDGDPVNAGSVSDLPLLPGERVIMLRVSNSHGSTEHSITVTSVIDTDGDGLDDEWEAVNGFDPLSPDAVEEDLDGDGLSLGIEYLLGTDPADPDTDGDGDTDGHEHAGAGDPLDAQSLAGPVHGVDDHHSDDDDHSHDEASALPPDVPITDEPTIPVLIVVLAALAVLAPLSYWLIRRTKAR